MTSTLQVIALDAKIQVDSNPDVVAYYNLNVCGQAWAAGTLASQLVEHAWQSALGKARLPLVFGLVG